jgi:hypothetical protein
MSEIQFITEEELTASYDEALDTYGPIQIGNLTYGASWALQKLDPIAYEIGLGEYADSLAEDGVFCEGYTEPENYDNEGEN